MDIDESFPQETFLSSNEPSEEEKRQAQQGEEMFVQQDGQWVWVDTRSRYEKYIDKWGTVALNPYQRAYVTGLKIRRNVLGNNSLNGFEKNILSRVTSNGLLRLPKRKINTPTRKGYYTKK